MENVQGVLAPSYERLHENVPNERPSQAAPITPASSSLGFSFWNYRSPLHAASFWKQIQKQELREPNIRNKILNSIRHDCHPYSYAPSPSSMERYANVSSKYQYLRKIGSGSYGEVFEGKSRANGQTVAIKDIPIPSPVNKFDIADVRELKVLAILRHENVVNLIDICKKRSNRHDSQPRYSLVFEFCNRDLAAILFDASLPLNFGHLKEMFFQMLKGIDYVHSQGVMHRDLKPENVLLTSKGVLKLADFGLSRLMKKINNERYTNCLGTVAYTPPEILLGSTEYDTAIDMWSTGCIFVEMCTRKWLFKGDSEISQLKEIISLCGPKTTETGRSVENLQVVRNITNVPPSESLKPSKGIDGFINDELASDIVDRLLVLEPSKRLSAKEVLTHEFFLVSPQRENFGEILCIEDDDVHRTSLESIRNKDEKNKETSDASS